MQETYAYDGGDYDRIDWTVHTLDELGRPTESYKSDGTQIESTWACCGKEWEKDENGVEHYYTHDALKRVTESMKKGIAAGTYPAQVDIYTDYTYDAAGRRLTEIVSAGGLTNSTSTQYDLAGRVTESVNSAGLVTETEYANGGRTTTVTLPGGYSRVTERYKDGKTKNVTGTAGVPQYYEYGVNGDGTLWTKIYAATAESAVWVKTTTDLLGRTAKVEKPGYSGTETVENFYNDDGQLVKTTQSGMADTLFSYDSLGNQTRSGLDVNDNGSLDLASMDRITESDKSYELISDIWYLTSVSMLYATDSSSAVTTNSITRQRLTGLSGGTRAVASVLDSLGNETVSTTTVDRNNKLVTQTTDVPSSSSNMVSVTVNGLVQSLTAANGLQSTVYSYDSLGRRTGTTDPRTGTSTSHYDSQGQVDYVENAAANRTSYTYDSAGRRASVTDPLSN
ncbi:hypothetical protein ACFLQR_04455, partial [Verrucomicrobiota bacterium]